MMKLINRITQIKSTTFLWMFMLAIAYGLCTVLFNGVGPQFAQAVSNPKEADKIIKEVHNYYNNGVDGQDGKDGDEGKKGDKGEKGDKGDKGDKGEDGTTTIIYVPAEPDPMPQPVDPPIIDEPTQPDYPKYEGDEVTIGKIDVVGNIWR